MTNNKKTFDECNSSLKKIFNNFEVIFFDDDAHDKSGVVHLKKSGENAQELDAIAIKDNIILLINIYSGDKKENIVKKIKPFFRNLRYITDMTEDIRFEISNQRTKKGRISKQNCEKIKKRINDAKRKYKIICKKVVFCRNLKVYPEEIIGISDSEKIIDETHNRCFEYILDNVGEAYLKNELFYFLDIKMRDLKKKITSVYKDRPELTEPFPCLTNIKLEEGTNKEMYSLCVPVSEIIEYVHVFRSADYYNKDAFQRMVNGDRIKKISKKYLKMHTAFPNNIILALNPKYYTGETRNEFKPKDLDIRLYKEYGSLIIIDGQHRLLSHLINSERDIDKKVLLNLIFFPNKNTAYDEMRETFYVINTTQKKLDRTLALRILSINTPNALVSIFYKIFDQLNKEQNSYLFDKIEFREKELRVNENKLHISSVIAYGGLSQIVKGKGKKIKGLKDIKEETADPLPFYKNIIRRYFDVIGEVIKPKRVKLTPVQLGGLLRLIRQFLNDSKTRNIIIELSKLSSGPTPKILKDKLKKYLQKIPFNKLSQRKYASNEWGNMEGFFVGCIRKTALRFGNATVLSEKGQKEIKIGKRF